MTYCVIIFPSLCDAFIRSAIIVDGASVNGFSDLYNKTLTDRGGAGQRSPKGIQN